MRIASFCQRTSLLIISGCLAAPALGFDIYSLQTKTGKVTQITDAEGDKFNPTWSNNGKQIAYETITDGISYLYITDVKKGQTQRLDETEGGNDVSWSPNGNWLAYDTNNKPVPDLFIMAPENVTPQLLRSGGIDPSWSNNSKNLAFIDVNTPSLNTINLETGTEITVVEGADWLSIGQPSWSPNGNYIAFTATRLNEDFNPVEDIYVVAVDQAGNPAGDPMNITGNVPDVFAQRPSWLNNSSSVIYFSNRDDEDGAIQIWMTSVSGDLHSVVYDGDDVAEGPFDPVVSNNGKQVAFSAR